MKRKNWKAEAGQLRRWAFIRNNTDNVAGPALREGKCVLVVGIDGVRCDTMQEGGSAESFYVDWVCNNSVDVSSEQG